jgi:hypothetical protein
LPPAAAECYIERGYVKRFFTALRAELYFERHVIFTISRSEIVRMTCRSKEYSAAAGGKRLFTQPRLKLLFGAKHRKSLLRSPCQNNISPQ